MDVPRHLLRMNATPRPFAPKLPSGRVDGLGLSVFRPVSTAFERTGAVHLAGDQM